jgi:shikimate dehydrogenase
MIDAQTTYVAIFGNPITHSLSPQMHNAAFNHLGLNLAFLAFKANKAAEAAVAIRTLGLHGASITIPHKEAIMEHLDEVDDVGQAIGAVNTVVAQEGRLLGSNTDWLGVVRALEQVTELGGKRCLVLGAGGAARAAIFGLQKRGAEVCLMNRNQERGRSLAVEMNCIFVEWQSWDGLEIELLINATPVGMSATRDQSLISAQQLKESMVVLDMVYRPLETRLLKDAAAAGSICVSGLEMLLQQGVAQFEIWTGHEAPFAVMRQALIESLANETNQNP